MQSMSLDNYDEIMNAAMFLSNSRVTGPLAEKFSRKIEAAWDAALYIKPTNCSDIANYVALARRFEMPGSSRMRAILRNIQEAALDIAKTGTCDSADVSEFTVRRAAKRLGWRVYKSRVRKRTHLDRGLWRLVDGQNSAVVGNFNNATLTECAFMIEQERKRRAF